MNNSVITFPLPANEPVKAYLAGSPERVALEKELERQSNLVVDIPIIIGGKEIRTGDTGQVTALMTTSMCWPPTTKSRAKRWRWLSRQPWRHTSSGAAHHGPHVPPS